jgi:hypothetical protein
MASVSSTSRCPLDFAKATDFAPTQNPAESADTHETTGENLSNNGSTESNQYNILVACTDIGNGLTLLIALAFADTIRLRLALPEANYSNISWVGRTWTPQSFCAAPLQESPCMAAFNLLMLMILYWSMAAVENPPPPKLETAVFIREAAGEGFHDAGLPALVLYVAGSEDLEVCCKNICANRPPFSQ